MRAVSCHYTFIVEVLLTLQTAYKAQMSALIEMERFISIIYLFSLAVSAQCTFRI